MKRTIGVFAHVDAGKTTFCESLLYLNQAISKSGRVDDQNTVMDHDPVEKRRGITIFSDIASFEYEGSSYYLIDTPGHADFSAEMERVMDVLDGAVLLISAVEGIQSHTLTVYRLLRQRNVPVYLFLNKADRDIADVEHCLNDIEKKLTKDIFYIKDQLELENDELCEWMSDYDDLFMEKYLNGEQMAENVQSALSSCISKGLCSLVHSGSALKQEGISQFVRTLSMTLLPGTYEGDTFSARLFKVNFDKQGNQVAYIKCLSGVLKVKDEVRYRGEIEKIHNIRLYKGKDYIATNEIGPGDVAGIIGIRQPRAGSGLGSYTRDPEPQIRPALKASVYAENISHDTCMSVLKKLEAQDPLLQVTYESDIRQIHVNVMGKIQLDVLQEVLSEREGIQVTFGPCKVVYRETIASEITGYGHYEPLRHYAEVHLKMTPQPGKGFTFSSVYPLDKLPSQHQNLIGMYACGLDHRGVLTGSALTDIHFTLTAGAHHLKHTEGGDFREAVCRAIRQGLEKADSLLLEPYYSFIITIQTDHMGRVMSDITRLNGTFQPPEIEGEQVIIRGRGPVVTFMDYVDELQSFTKGKGAVSMSYQGYYPCHNAEEVIAEIGYEKDRDLNNVSSSIFCKKGAGYEVKWYEAESYMHL